MTLTSTPAPAPDALQRRVDDLPLPGQPLYWGEDGTPLPPSSVVYQYRPQADERHRLWSDITTQELLAYVKAAPERFELRTLFTVSVEDLARAPLATILEARLQLDRIKAATEKAISGMREVARETAVKP
ncbi:hypothetical protein [Massilia timonae]|uniref:Uncharacterized protein n=1 Tax=Massilia timonae TaxID=47229 RepID=A0A1S2NBI3_9BURK|nr:hypothetical protein [Massilia timonae]OIJ42024.1 hypothetical protein LO55_5065 [Massilia timonae]